jgi:diguanylate cyclase (GGDEF)-like protein/PAS domain S-box-containing protein
MPSADALKVLLVEDDEDDFIITRGMLRSQSRTTFDVDWAAAYGEALDAIRERRHDLYLVDYRLGERTGLDLIREAWGGNPQAPVILLTGQDDYEVDLEATALGVTDYLVKGATEAAALERTIRYAVRDHRAMGDLRRSEERYAVAVRATNDGIWDWDLLDGSMHFSPRWKSLLGYGDDADFRGPEAWFDLVHPDDVERLRAEIDLHLDGHSGYVESEHRIRHSDGQWRWVLTRGLASRDGDGRPTRMTGSLSDVTERHEAQEQLIHGALHDGLTGLPNRALFTDRLLQCLRHVERDPGYRCAVLFIDVDRFKLVNDSLSHALGDRLLVELARRVEPLIRSEDTLARLGGDEFTILLDGIDDPAQALTAAQRIERTIAEPFSIDGGQLIIAASIGIAHNGDGTPDADELIRNADIAMYDAKRQGGARCAMFDRSMHERVISRVAREAELRQAIEQRSIRTFFQPVVNLDSGVIRGFEALARWPEGEDQVPPSEFIPIAEEAGLIGPLGNLILTSACRTLRQWREQGLVEPDVTISVNVSPRQLTDPTLVDEVSAALADAELPPANLVLEITESTLIESPELISVLLRDLLALGVGIQLDDFGTGYSSLTVLHHFPGDTLKIDRSFVTTLTDREESHVIIRSIIGLAHNLGLAVIAEGIEHHPQIRALTDLGCEYGQGFCFARPLPGDEMERVLSAHLGMSLV